LRRKIQRRGRKMPAPPSERNYFLSALSVAQPPLPLQEFLPLQPWSPDLQPPLPLHEFLPLQACLSASAMRALAWAGETTAPAIMPATAAPISFEKSLRFMRYTPNRF